MSCMLPNTDQLDPDYDVYDAAYWKRKCGESEDPWEEDDYEYVQASESELRWRKKAAVLKKPLAVYEARLVEIEKKIKEVKQLTGNVPESILTVRGDIRERRNLYLYHMNAAEDLARDFAQLTRIHRSVKAQVI